MITTLLIVCLIVMCSSSLASQGLNRKPGWPGTALSGTDCYGKLTGYGPHDYNTEKEKIWEVEAFHFLPKMESLDGEYKYKILASNFDYTLRAVPNHHRALWAYSRLYLRALKYSGRAALEESERAQKSTAAPECYFQRAKVFNPNDWMVWAIYGIYLHKRGELQASLTEYQRAEEELPNHAELIYNMGLLYFDMGDLAKARDYADRAENLGYPLRGLDRKIIDAGRERREDMPATR